MLLALLALAFAQDGPTTPPEQEPAGVELPPLVKGPELLEFVQAPYPPEAEAAGIEATVHLLIGVDATGAVSRVTLLELAGHGFDEAAVLAARSFRFSPAEDANGPVAVELEFDYGFTLAPAVEAAPVEQPITLEGELTEMATQFPVGGAHIRATLAGALVGEATSDQAGHFELRGVEPGMVRLTAVHPGHQDGDAEVEVTSGEVTHVTVWMRSLGYRDGLVATYDRVRPPEVTRRTLSIAEIRQVPGTFGDPVRVIQSLPGAARAPFSSGLLVLRGANPEDSNVYVDGVEVPLIYHLGGFRSIQNPNFIDSVDYLPGTYGTHYGRSTGGVVDVKSTSNYPQRPQTTWRTDFLDSGVFFRGRAGKKIGFAAGVRKSYLDLLLKAVLNGTGAYAAPRWFDYQVKVESLDAGADDLSAFLFGFQDDLIIRFGDGTDDQLGTHYSSHRLVLRYAHPLSDTLKLEVQPAFGIDGTRFGFGSLFTFESSRLLVDLRGALAWKPVSQFGLALGLDAEAAREGFEIAVGSVPVDGDNELSETEPFATESGAWQFTPDPFVEATIRPLTNEDRLVLIAGARLDLLVRTEVAVVAAVDPRFAGRFEVFRGGTFKAGTGLYNQPPQGIDLYFGSEGGFERAWASEAGWEQKFGQSISADVTGFYRWMDQLNVSSPFGDLTGDEEVPTGVGRAYGMEVMVRHALQNRFFGWIAYTLSRSERNDTPDDPEGWHNYDYDQTHILTAVAGYRLPLDFELSGRFQYVTGNPYTPYDGGLFDMDSGGYYGFPSANTNSARMPAYNALDLRISKLFTFTHWQLDCFADFLNVYNRKNPEFIQYNYDYTDHTFITGLPFIPSLGFEARVKL